MAIKIGWINRNSRAINIEIYRSETAMDTRALPPVLATVPGTDSNYIDASAVPGSTYFYLTAAVDEVTGSKVFGRQRQYTAQQYRGPGPQVLLTGDERFGFYGQVANAEMAPLSSIYPWVPESTNANYRFYKFVRNNKILIVTDRVIDTDMGRTYPNPVGGALIRSGLPANKKAVNAAITTTYSDNILNVDNFRFHVRCAYIMADSWLPTDPPTTGAVANTDRSEFSDLMAALGSTFDPAYSRLPVSQIQHAVQSVKHPVMGPEVWNNLSYPVRSTLANTTTAGVYYATEFITQKAQTGGGSSTFILPVLELIES